MSELFSRSANTITERFDDTLVVLDYSSGSAVQLNASAACVWESLAAPADVEHVAGRLASRFGIAADRALTDARSAIDGLVARALVTRTTTAAER